MPGGNCSIISGIVADAMKLINVYKGLLLMVVNVCHHGLLSKGRNQRYIIIRMEVDQIVRGRIYILSSMV